MSHPRISFHKLTLAAFAPAPEIKQLPIQSLYAYEKIISEYSKGAQQEVFQDQFNYLIDLYLAWGQEHKCQTPAVIGAVAKIKKDLFLPEFSGMQSNLYFESIKQNLEKILLVFQNEQIPLDNRKKEYARLCESFAVCGPGLHTHIEDTYYRLNPELSVERWLADLRTNLIKIFAEKYINENEIPDGNSIHVTKVFSSYAVDQKWNPTYSAQNIQDPYASGTGITAGDLVKFHTYFEKEYNAEAIHQCLQANIDEVFVKICDEFGYKLNDWNPIARDYVKFMEKLSGVLENLGIKLNTEEFCELSEECSEFRLNINNIVNTLGKGLFHPNFYFHPAKKIFCDLVPESWLNGKSEIKKFDYTIWEEIPAKQFPSILFKIITLIPDQHINSLLNNMPRIQLLGMVSQAEIYSRYLSTIKPEHRRSSIKTAIEGIADFTKLDQDGNTAAHLAAQYGFVEVIERLIESKADLTTPDKLGRTPIQIAAQYGCGEIITALAAEKINLNIKKDDGESLAHIAAFYGHPSVIKALWEEKVNLDIANSSGDTPLILAVLKNNLEIVKKLISYGVDVLKSNTENGKTPLHYAIKESNFEAIKILLEKGVNLSLIDTEGKTPLDYANPEVRTFIALQQIRIHIKSQISEKEYSQGGAKIVDLIDKIKPTNKDYKLELQKIMFLAVEDQPTAVKMLAEAGVDLSMQDIKGKTLAHIAAENGQNAILDILSIYGADLNKVDNIGQTLLFYAAKGGFVDTIRQVAEMKGIDLSIQDQYGETPAHIATKYGHAEAIKTLFSCGVSIDTPSHLSQTPLFWATNGLSIKNPFEIIKALIECGASLYTTDGLGNQPIGYRHSNLKMLSALLQIKAHFVSQISKEGSQEFGRLALKRIEAVEHINDEIAWISVMQDIMFMAAEYGQLDIIKILNEIKVVDLNKNNSSDGLTLAHIAINKGNTELIQFLIDAGADLNTEDFYGRASLHYAVEQDRIEILQLLAMQRDIDLDIPDMKDSTPLNDAFRRNNVQAIKMLIDQGADICIRDEQDLAAVQDADPKTKQFYILLLLEKYISIHYFSEGEYPRILFSSQYIRIKKALDEHDYAQGVQDVIKMAKEYSSSSSYSKWFDSPDNLIKQLSAALEKEKVKHEFEVSEVLEKTPDEKKSTREKPTDSIKERAALIKKIKSQVCDNIEKEIHRLLKERAELCEWGMPKSGQGDYVHILYNRTECLSLITFRINKALELYEKGDINKIILRDQITHALDKGYNKVVSDSLIVKGLKKVLTGIFVVSTLGFFASPKSICIESETGCEVRYARDKVRGVFLG